MSLLWQRVTTGQGVRSADHPICCGPCGNGPIRAEPAAGPRSHLAVLRQPALARHIRCSAVTSADPHVALPQVSSNGSHQPNDAEPIAVTVRWPGAFGSQAVSVFGMQYVHNSFFNTTSMQTSNQCLQDPSTAGENQCLCTDEISRQTGMSV